MQFSSFSVQMFLQTPFSFRWLRQRASDGIAIVLQRDGPRIQTWLRGFLWTLLFLFDFAIQRGLEVMWGWCFGTLPMHMEAWWRGYVSPPASRFTAAFERAARFATDELQLASMRVLDGYVQRQLVARTVHPSEFGPIRLDHGIWRLVAGDKSALRAYARRQQQVSVDMLICVYFRTLALAMTLGTCVLGHYALRSTGTWYAPWCLDGFLVCVCAMVVIPLSYLMCEELETEVERLYVCAKRNDVRWRHTDNALALIRSWNKRLRHQARWLYRRGRAQELEVFLTYRRQLDACRACIEDSFSRSPPLTQGELSLDVMRSWRKHVMDHWLSEASKTRKRARRLCMPVPLLVRVWRARPRWGLPARAA